MLRDLTKCLFVSSLLISSICASSDDSHPRCNCNEDKFWSIESILECQRVMVELVVYCRSVELLLYHYSCFKLSIMVQTLMMSTLYIIWSSLQVDDSTEW